MIRPSREEGIAILELDDPASRNALSTAMVERLRGALSEVSADPDVRVVVLLGSPDIFCSGAPRALLEALAKGALDPFEIGLAAALLEVPVPTISGMEGHAVGGGLALGFCADLVVMARQSRYGVNFMEYGFTPGMGSTSLLEHALSPAVAHELLYTGELRRGRDFEGRSGVNHVVDRAEVRGLSLDLARRIAAKPRDSLLLLKAHLAGPRRAAFAAARRAEAQMHALTFSRPETLARIRAEFAEEP